VFVFSEVFQSEHWLGGMGIRKHVTTSSVVAQVLTTKAELDIGGTEI
jgi:hypothetical protein